MADSALPIPPLSEVYDIAVIGGGINGVGIAADASGRGLSVFLCEKDDLASHTSSASSKLIHGGLRYLEHYEFRLVREALAEREVLLEKAPHIVKPMRFVLPHRPHLRPAWMIRAGLFLYDHLGKREKLPGSKNLRFGASSPLKSTITRGFEYSDCWVDDARLVVLNAMAAREKGAHIHTQTRCLNARRSNGLWHLNMERADGSLFSIRAKALVNAAGPWVAKFIREDLKLESQYGIRLIQGSHLIVPKLYEGENAFILQNEDQRIVFAIPYLDQFTIIGTTDREYTGDPAKVAITEGETDYLLKIVNEHFKKQLTRGDIIRTYSGVRPLCNDESDNPSAITRDYTLSLSGSTEEAPILSVFGGKLTTYRKLAESAMQQLAPFFPQMKPSWTARASLPGGENMTTPAALASELEKRCPWLPSGLAKRWAITYGSRSWQIVDGLHDVGDLGEHLGADLYSAEVDYLCRAEWVTQADDVLWRRTKLGLFTTAEEQQNVQAYLDKVAHRKSTTAAA
ncbi:glycerol-3-phosphate dehydrogenase [Pseudomonas sp. GD03842]|uniref:glycerol-3-phosphate dehydrogenase n=1 Tax=unclassified Pseudomonas TaxID=196821 RepID=UPI000D368718|nr:MULTISPECIES: glycerol-3-phosphate dehydrogenase [unclassified Pseudomonas]MDH0748594.1 glycerol-3-phosphate dehydrogenase [Pseudomonas sp. GD03842]RAU43303.1 glycerol-3-phosphate dehydrogenase [Pseudomonas sp. RIT 409]RAU50347.1 glycerol-3-phosphate dehydrogenase [Pseudomonas sp. RIT 412]